MKQPKTSTHTIQCDAIEHNKGSSRASVRMPTEPKLGKKKKKKKRSKLGIEPRPGKKFGSGNPEYPICRVAITYENPNGRDFNEPAIQI